MPAAKITVIPANAGIQFVGLIAFKNNQMNDLDSRIRGNDGEFSSRLGFIYSL